MSLLPFRQGLLAVAATLSTSVAWAAPSPSASSLEGKIVVGYQGWFSCPGDGSGLERWNHWGFRPDAKAPDAATKATVDLWPDVSEFAKDERFPAPVGGEVFSSHHPKTVARHFQWMRDYGIDAAFVQRFAGVLRDPKMARFTDAVLSHCQAGAEANGRAFCVMYDLSGLREGDIGRLVHPDWRRLRGEKSMTGSPAYQHDRGKPLVVVWGVGFNDGRAYTLAECEALVDFLKADGCRVMLGVPYFWREGKHDAVSDPALSRVLAKADILSPWTVGRYRSPDEVAQRHARRLQDDLDFCRARSQGYIPVAFPGFSWRNLMATRGKTSPLNDIPRLKGEFLWSQVRASVNAGASTVYIAMFDEVDEGTAIFKCSNNPPVGPDGVPLFLGYEGLAPDTYLWLAGQAGRALRREIPAGFPVRK